MINTFVVSDLHLTEVNYDESKPLWMCYKREEFSIDNDFKKFLQHIKSIPGPTELVLNGDTFDFDYVTQAPANADWLAKRRGLGSQEWMSIYKMEIIIKDHRIWFESMREFAKTNKVVFVIGNHDVELHWPSVQQMVKDQIDHF